MRRAPFGLVAIVFAATSVAAQGFDVDAKRCASDREVPEIRIASCTRVIESGRLTDVGMGLAFTNRGNAHYALGRYREALRDNSQAVRLAPGEVSPYVNRANVYARLGAIDNAIGDLDRALRVDPKNAIVWKNLGIFQILAGNYNSAIGAFDKAIELAPAEPEHRDLRAKAFRSLAGTWSADYAPAAADDYAKAIRDHDEAIRLNPREAMYYYDRAMTYARMKQYERAIADFDAAIRLKPGYSDAYELRGRVFADMGRYDKAIEDFSQAVQLAPANAGGFQARGTAYLHEGRLVEAAKDLDRAIELSQGDPESFYRRGLARFRQGQVLESIADFEAALKLKPKNDADALRSLGEAYLSNQQLGEALLRFTWAINARRIAENRSAPAPQDFDDYFSRGVANFAAGNFKAAAEDFRAASDLKPRDIHAPLMLYLAQAKAGQEGKVELAKRAGALDLSRWPGPLIRLHLGRASSADVRAAQKPPEYSPDAWACGQSFHLGMYALVESNRAEAERLLRETANPRCRALYGYLAVAKAELKRLGAS
jgi:tetratricopeptide (TPR) repeat protein